MLFLVVLYGSVAALGAQGASDQIKNTLWGDVTVDQPEGVKVPQALTLILMEPAGREVNRDSLPPNGRYRFFNVANGPYLLTIEVESRVVYQERILLNESVSTDVRKNIALEWKVKSPPVDSAEILYARSDSQGKLLEAARKSASSGDRKKAVELLEKLVQGDGEDFEAWTELGTARFQSEQYGRASEAYAKALAIRPDFLPALVNLGKLKLAQKQFDQAIEPLTRAVKQDPERAESQYLLGEAYLGMRKGSQAVAYLNEALRLDPVGMAPVHLRLARLYDLAGMKDRAVREYEQYLQKKPDAPERDELERYIARNKDGGS